jgi:polyisoprenoid-binding protein YceI
MTLATTPRISTWSIDPAHTDIQFSAKHMMVTTVRGKFQDVSGTLTIVEDDPTLSRGEIRIAAATLNTGVELRDNHLRSADFFDAANHPEIVFTISDVAAISDETYRVTGHLTIRGTTRPVTFDANFLGFYEGMQGGRRAGFDGRLKINRKDWGLGWNVALEKGGWLVGEDVSIELDVAFDQAVEATAAAA